MMLDFAALSNRVGWWNPVRLELTRQKDKECAYVQCVDHVCIVLSVDEESG